MSTADRSAPATRAAWTVRPLPAARADLPFRDEYSQAEFELLQRGLIPREMEDKWFIFFEEPWLYLHRSWSDACIYAVRFEPMGDGVKAAEAWANRKRSEYKDADDGYDTVLLRFLIEALLLGKEVPFPVPTGEAYAPGLLQANIVGRAYPEISYGPRSDQRSFWTWLKGWF